MAQGFSQDVNSDDLENVYRSIEVVCQQAFAVTLNLGVIPRATPNNDQSAFLNYRSFLTNRLNGMSHRYLFLAGRRRRVIAERRAELMEMLEVLL